MGAVRISTPLELKIFNSLTNLPRLEHGAFADFEQSPSIGEHGDGSFPSFQPVAQTLGFGYAIDTGIQHYEVAKRMEVAMPHDHPTTYDHALSYWAVNADASDGSANDKLTDEDLVLVLDASSVLLQLPPSILLQRYFRINARANNLVPQLYDTNVADLIRQTVIVPAQKECIGHRDLTANRHHNHITEGTLSSDIDGTLTDLQLMSWESTRPEQMHSGSFMGPVGDLRRYLRRVKDKIQRDKVHLGQVQQVGTHQSILSEVLREQELWRRATGEPKDLARRIATQDEFEYHVGLDYTQELFHPTSLAECDGAFIPLADQEVAKKESSRRGISPPRVQIPNDVAKLDNPLAMFGGKFSQGNYGWGNLTLFTDLWTASVPVVIQQGPSRQGLKELWAMWWEKTWFFPYLRVLLDISIYSRATDPLLRLTTDNNSLDISGYGSTLYPRMPRLFIREGHIEEWNLEVAHWNSICRSATETAEGNNLWYNEVFRDGKGPL
ncbi:hypothetical protein F66182_10350 [Fusarium sp. NRRL 66182]|nr:hypothetical protein F66182_10350 [Fusarium sp. NRRL 66182]